MPSALIAGVEALSAIAALALVYSTLKACRTSSVQYLLGIPAGFGLMTIAFATNALAFSVDLPTGNLPLFAVYLLTQTYGLLFLALTYARRTRLKFIGESVSIEFAIPSLMTLGVLIYAFASPTSSSVSAVPESMDLTLRVVTALSALYLLYETGRNWSLTKRPGEGVVIIGFALLFIEQLGFLLAAENFGDIAVFVGYEGRIVGLLVLIAVTYVGIRKGDFTTGLKRLGLTAPAH
jgi:hypothetical protein